jgi:glycine/D-amino acid oxidase-like deaminating enzyme
MADQEFRAVVAGAGVSGLFMAEMLKRAGIDFTVYEKAGEVGGTWRDNTFPGLFVDVLSRQYEFPFQPNYNWSRKYAPATEIWAYIKKVAHDRDLNKFIRFNQEIVSARFSNDRWHLKTASGNSDIADVFICATGFLHKPLLPAIPGRESFAGPSFHSARWDHSVPYVGKRWGVIGSGASGVQSAGLGRLRCHPVHPPRAMGPHSREPVLDPARTLETAVARRVCPRATPAVALHQRQRPMAPRTRAAARSDGARVPFISRLHPGPRAEAEAHSRL